MKLLSFEDETKYLHTGQITTIYRLIWRGTVTKYLPFNLKRNISMITMLGVIAVTLPGKNPNRNLIT